MWLWVFNPLGTQFSSHLEFSTLSYLSVQNLWKWRLGGWMDRLKESVCLGDELACLCLPRAGGRLVSLCQWMGVSRNDSEEEASSRALSKFCRINRAWRSGQWAMVHSCLSSSPRMPDSRGTPGMVWVIREGNGSVHGVSWFAYERFSILRG